MVSIWSAINHIQSCLDITNDRVAASKMTANNNPVCSCIFSSENLLSQTKVITIQVDPDVSRVGVESNTSVDPPVPTTPTTRHVPNLPPCAEPGSVPIVIPPATATYVSVPISWLQEKAKRRCLTTRTHQMTMNCQPRYEISQKAPSRSAHCRILSMCGADVFLPKECSVFPAYFPSFCPAGIPLPRLLRPQRPQRQRCWKIPLQSGKSVATLSAPPSPFLSTTPALNSEPSKSPLPANALSTTTCAKEYF